jgi:hypothetical protein
MSQYIPPTAMMPITGTWTEIAGQVAGTIAKHKAAAAETSIVYIPILLPSNSAVDASGSPTKGSLLKSVEIDYEVLVAACTSVTAALTKIKRGADGAVAVVSTQASTQDLAAATDAADVDQHKLTVTVTTPPYIENDEYFILTLTIVAAATTQFDVLAAVANFTFRA